MIHLHLLTERKTREISHKTYPEPYFSSENKCYPISPFFFFFFLNQALPQSPKLFTHSWIPYRLVGSLYIFVFVLSCPFPFYICRSRFLLGNTGIMNDILSPSSVLCSSFHPSLCSLTAYSPATRITGKNTLYPVCSSPISCCFPILWVLFCSPGKEKNVFLLLSPLS